MRRDSAPSRSPSALRRVWRTQIWNANPLMRASDRWEAVSQLLMVAAMLIAIPVACAIGTAVYTGTGERIATENASKSPLTAHVLTEPKATGTANSLTTARYDATVSWDRDGRSHTAVVDVGAQAKAGSSVRIWLGPDGAPTGPPEQPGVAAWNGVGTALAATAAFWVGAIVLQRGAVGLLDRGRARRWGAAWQDLARPIGT